MALSVSIMKKSVFGDQRVVFGEVAFDSSYPTGGEELDLVDLTGNFLGSPSEYSFLLFAPTGGYTFEWVASSGSVGNLKAFAPIAVAAHTHTIPVTAGTAGNAVTNNAGVLESSGGQDLTTASGGAVTAGPDEVANTTDLSSSCAHVQFMIVGV